MCSVLFVAPDTMKNVAATSGQRDSFATGFFAVGRAREARWAGNGDAFNSWFHPLQAKLAFRTRVERVHDSQNTSSPQPGKQKIRGSENFCGRIAQKLASRYPRRLAGG